MKLMRIGAHGRERAAVGIDAEHFVDVHDEVGDFDECFFGSGRVATLRATVDDAVARGSVHLLAGRRIGPPIARPHQIIGIGMNYLEHIRESGGAVPEEPVVFNKAPNSISGPYDDVRLPRGHSKTDWEVELGIVVGSRASYLQDASHALSAIAGYVLANDISERSFQLEREGQWAKGKSAETFTPVGPWLATPDEIPDINDMNLWLERNGRLYQDSSTSELLFDPGFIVHYLSQFMVLEPGDLILTGTPSGVGLGLRPQEWLAPGDQMRLGAAGLGIQSQTVVAPTHDPTEVQPATSIGR